MACAWRGEEDVWRAHVRRGARKCGGYDENDNAGVVRMGGPMESQQVVILGPMAERQGNMG